MLSLVLRFSWQLFWEGGTSRKSWRRDWKVGLGVSGGWGTRRWVATARTVSPPPRKAALGVSFGLVACVLALVLGLCFADELLVSEPPDVW